MVKKLLLTAAIAAVASAAFPQGKAIRPSQQANKAAQKSVYYLKPAGVPFEATAKNGNITGTTYLYVPGYYEVKFEPVAPQGGEIFWHQNLYDMYGTCTSYDRTGKESFLYSSDNDGNFYLKCRMNSANALPTIVCGTDSFTLSEENPHWGPLDYDLPAVMYWYPQLKSGTLDEREKYIRPLQFVDDKVNTYYLGGMNNGYLLGSGTVTENNYQAYGVQQVIEKPVAPLWVEDIFLPALSKTNVPIPADKQLKMTVTNVKEGDDGLKLPGIEVIAELYCTLADLEEQGTLTDDETGQKYYMNACVFKSEDGGFLVDDEFAIVITGLEQEGVDVGFTGSEIPYYNKVMQPANSILSVGGVVGSANIYSDNRIALGVSLSAKFDYANGYVDYSTEGDNNYNYGIVQIDNDGRKGTTIANPNLTFEGAVVQINGDWYDDKGNEQYSLSGMEPWVKSYKVDDESYKYAGLTVISFICDPLPEGVAGRGCDVLIHGKGVTSNQPITIIQGDATGIKDAKGETTVDEDAPMYNTAGQQVGKDYKGIVIQNGAKRVNK